MSEAGAFARDAIEVWGADFGGPVAAEVTIAKVVGENQDHVGFACSGFGWLEGQQAEEKCAEDFGPELGRYGSHKMGGIRRPLAARPVFFSLEVNRTLIVLSGS